MEACHNNGNGLDNRLENLRWDTREGNERDKDRHGRRLRGEKHPFASLSAEDAAAIRREYSGGGVTQAELGAKYGVTQTTVSKIVRGATWRDYARERAEEIRRVAD